MPVRPPLLFRLFACVFALGLAAPSWGQQDAQIRIVQREALVLGTPQASESVLDVVSVRFVDGGWKREAIEAAFRQGATILAQCEVRLARVEFVVVDAPREFQLYSTPVSRNFARRAAFSRPTVYFVRDTLNLPAFDAEAIGRSNSGTRPELLNTIWVTQGTPDLGIALAHELAHLLMDNGAHAEAAGNLMRADTAVENTRLDADQCARMLRSGREGGLLR